MDFPPIQTEQMKIRHSAQVDGFRGFPSVCIHMQNYICSGGSR